MATKTVAGIKIKTKTERTKLTGDEQLTGAEPTWTGDELGVPYNTKLRDAMFYCNHHYTAKDLKRDVIKYVDKLAAFSKDEMRELASAYDSKSIVSMSTAASLCRAGVRGAPLIDQHKQFIINTFRDAIAHWRTTKQPDPVAATPSQVAARPTIQDRLAEKLSEYIAHFEGLYDEVIMGSVTAPGTYEYFKANSVPQAQINKISAFFGKRIAEIEEAQAGTDAQLKEAYKHYKARDYKRHLDFLKKIVEDCESYYRVKQTTRKARVRKAPSKDKQVEKLKFRKEDPQLKLVSINPAEIIGATELWCYNARTRKLGRYVADEYAKELSVKGTSIQGFDAVKSVQKTLRKPAEQLKEFMKASKVQTRKFLDTVRTTETVLTGRINDDVLLLKVV